MMHQRCRQREGLGWPGLAFLLLASWMAWPAVYCTTTEAPPTGLSSLQAIWAWHQKNFPAQAITVTSNEALGILRSLGPLSAGAAEKGSQPELRHLASRLLLKLTLEDAPKYGKDPVKLQEVLSAIYNNAAHLPDGISFPFTRRVIIATLLKMQMEASRPWTQKHHDTATAILLQLYFSHRRAAKVKGVMEYLHVSKSGGTTM